MTNDAARDAALREEGRVQGLRVLDPSQRNVERVARETVGLCANPSCTMEDRCSICLGNVRRVLTALRALAAYPQPDASQGSAPVAGKETP